MNDFHQKIIEVRIKESNWKWIIKKIAIVASAILLLFSLLIFAVSSLGNNGATFTMSVANNYGDTYTISDSKRVPEGYYRIVCVNGHGLLDLNNVSSYLLAADAQKGVKFADQTYKKTATVYLAQGDTLVAYRYNDSKYKLEFHYIGETMK